MDALRSACARLPAECPVKYETVIGTIGNTHGVSSDSAPNAMAARTNDSSESLDGSFCEGTDAGTAAAAAAAAGVTGAEDVPAGGWIAVSAPEGTGCVAVGGRVRSPAGGAAATGSAVVAPATCGPLTWM